MCVLLSYLLKLRHYRQTPVADSDGVPRHRIERPQREYLKNNYSTYLILYTYYIVAK